MKKVIQVLSAVLAIAFMIGAFILGRESAIHAPVKLIQVSSDGHTIETIVPKDSLYKIECGISYVEIK